MENLYLVCIGLLIFFSFSLLTKKNKALSERIFSYWIILLLFTVTTFYLYARGMSYRFPVFVTLVCDSHLLNGAILLFYIRTFFNTNFKFKKKDAWHLVPTLVQIIAKLMLNLVFDKMDCYKQGGCVEDDNIYVTITNIYKYLVLGTYIALSWHEYIRYKKSNSTPRETMRSQWIKQIIMGVTFLFAGVMLIQLGKKVFPETFYEHTLYGNTLTTLFIFIFLYLGNSYTYIFVSPSKNRFINLSESFTTQSSKSGNTNSQVQKNFQTIEDYMKMEKPFTKSHLTLRDLSDALKLPQTTISQAINNETGRTVPDYINSYRVNLLKEKLQDKENLKYKILILADDCGFSSKATLSRIFKQHTGQTPTEYRKSVLGE